MFANGSLNSAVPHTRPRSGQPVSRLERLRVIESVVENAHDLILVVDRRGYIEYCNHSFLKATGYSSDQLRGRRAALLRSGQHPQTFYRHLWRTVLAGQVWQGELIQRRKNGTLFPVDLTVTPVLDSAGEVIRFLAIARNLSSRGQSGHRKKDARLFVESLIDLIPLPVFVQNLSGACILCNAEFERLSGHSRENILGRRAMDRLGGGTDRIHRGSDARTLRTRQPQVYEAMLEGVRGERRYFRIHKAAVDHGPVHSTSLIVVLVDLTDVRRLHDLESESNSTRRAVQAIRRIIQVIGHELRSPLCSIQAAAAVQGSASTDSAGTSRLGKLILNESSRASDVVDAILDLAQMVSGTATWSWERFDLVELLEEICRTASPGLDARPVTLDFIPVTSSLSLNGDRKALRRLFSSLIANALRFTEEGDVAVRVQESLDDGVRSAWVSVADTGPGIKAAILERLGVPFALSSGLIGEDQAHGTGLGLAIAKAILDAHGGHWEIKTGLGAGTRFEVFLPADENGPAEGH